jgi:hypothetical protein
VPPRGDVDFFLILRSRCVPDHRIVLLVLYNGLKSRDERNERRRSGRCVLSPKSFVGRMWAADPNGTAELFQRVQ